MFKNYKTFLTILVTLLVLILLLFRNPIGCNTPISHRDTITTVVTVVDTQWVKQDTVFVVKEVPVVNDSLPAPIIIIDTTNESLLAQYKRMASDYNAVKTYKGSTELKDSTGRVVGTFNYNDKVNKNSLISREPSYQLTLPYITKTTTITKTIEKEAPKRTQLYIGGEITGNKTDLINGANVGLLLKNKRDQIYTVGAGAAFINNGPAILQFKVGTYFKIGKR